MRRMRKVGKNSLRLYYTPRKYKLGDVSFEETDPAVHIINLLPIIKYINYDLIKNN